MTLTPADIRAASFDHARRGYDPDQVHAALSDAAATIERLRADRDAALGHLADSQTSEASLRSTMLAMSQAREEILETARIEAHDIAEHAAREARRAIARAEDEAAEIVMNARRQALDVIAEARHDADYLLHTAGEAAAPLTAKVEQLRAVVRRTENLMRGMASGALGDLAQAHLMLDEAPPDDTTAMQIVFSESEAEYVGADATVSPLPAAVDRLLSHLREIG